MAAVLDYFRRSFEYPDPQCRSGGCDDPVLVFGLSFLSNWVIFGLSALLCPLLVPGFDKVPKIKRPEWHTRCVSLSHVLAVPTAVLT